MNTNSTIFSQTVFNLVKDDELMKACLIKYHSQRVNCSLYISALSSTTNSNDIQIS